MSVFGAYAFSETAYSSAAVNVVVELTGFEATFAAFANTDVATGSTFTVTEIAAAQALYNDDITVTGSALFTVGVIDAAQTIFSGDTRIFDNVFGMTPERYLAYPKTITRDETILGVTNQSEVFAVIQNHMLYVINDEPGVYDGNQVRSTYNNQPIDPSFIGWIARADIRDPYRVAIGNLTEADRAPVGLIPRGAPAQQDIDILQDYFNGETIAADVLVRIQQLIWGVPNEFIANARTYATVENETAQSYSEETPAAGNTWNELVI